MSLQALLAVATERGKELQEIENQKKLEKARKKANELLLKTEILRENSYEHTKTILGKEHAISPDLWVPERVPYTDKFKLRLQLTPKLRLYFDGELLSLTIKREPNRYGYGDGWSDGTIKMVPNWETFCKLMAQYNKD